jgi:riboflavin transporter FmnP
MPYQNDGKQSKYLRNPNDRKSKYIRNGNERKSKYLRDQSEPKHHFNLVKNIREEEPEEEILDIVEELALDASVNTGKSPDSHVLDMIIDDIGDVELNSLDEKETQTKTDEATDDENPEMPKKSYEKYTFMAEKINEISEAEKGSSSVIKKPTNNNDLKNSAQQTVKNTSRSDARQSKRKAHIINMTLIIFFLTVVACLLQNITITPRFFPTMLHTEFSPFPELIASIAYGPIYGVLIALLKNVVHIIISRGGFVSELSNFILDSIFVTAAGLFYTRGMFAKASSGYSRHTDRRRQSIFMGGLIGTGVSTVAAYFLTTYVSYPLLIKQYVDYGVSEEIIIMNYQQALNRINTAFPEYFSTVKTSVESLSQAIMFFNVPINAAKYFIITIVSTIIYVFISPYLHFRRNPK